MCNLHKYDPAVLAGNCLDFSNKHGNTYVVHDTGQVAFLRRLSETGLQYDLYNPETKDVHRCLLDYKKDSLPFKQIRRKRRLFNRTGNLATKLSVFTNNPERRNRIGFCATTAMYYNIATPDRNAMYDLQIVTDYLDGNYVPLKEALDGHSSVAIDEQWGICKISSKDKPTGFMDVLYHYFTPVGVISETHVTGVNRLFEEEILDFMRKNNLPHTFTRGGK